jgi:hypothetical protein
MIGARPWPLVALVCALAACKGSPDADGSAKSAAETKAAEAPEAETEGQTDAAAQADAKPDPATSEVLERLFLHLPSETLTVSVDRTSRSFDPAVVAVVFGLPPKAASMLDQRGLLDEALDIVLDGDADPSHWLAATSLAFTIPPNSAPYFLRPLTKPAAELGPLLEQGFSKTAIDDIEVWMPTGSFPWRIALLDGDVAAFVPIGTVGTWLEPLLAAREAESSAVEQQLSAILQQDPGIELVLLAGGPLVHLDITQPIAQVEFALRNVGRSYEGQIVITPTGDVDECAKQLRERKHPEENQQVQALLAAVAFTVETPTAAPEQRAVVGRLAITSEQLEHFLDR